MVNYANQLARKLLARSGYIPNVENYRIEPGAILRRRRGRFIMAGRIDERARAAGDDTTADALAQIFAAVAQRADDNKHKFGLKYKSEGTTMLSFEGEGETVKVGEQSVKLNVLLEFEGRSDYLFDTTEPVSWKAFDATEIDDVLDASAKYLGRREMIVTGSGEADKWLWYISKSRSAQLGFSGEGGAGADVGKLADISTDLKLKVSRGELVDGRGEGSVAMFQALVRREFRPSATGTFALEAFRLLDDGVGRTPQEDVLAPVVPGDLDDYDDDA